MDKITTVGLDLAKMVIAVHAVDARGMLVLRKVLRRDALLAWSASLPPCVMAMEACGGAHHWARTLTRQGHLVRIMAAEFVKPFRKSGKNDANDAEAICTAVRQANMRFVAMKSAEQQAALCVHRLRQGLVEERTALINRLRGLLTEFGVVAPLSPEKLRRELARCQDPEDPRLPLAVRQLVGDQVTALDQLEERMTAYAEQIAGQARASETAQRLQSIAGVGPTTAAAMVATVGEPQEFRNGRQFAAWLGLVPKQHSTGGKTRLGRITKRGDAYLRTLLILGAKSALQSALRKPPAGRHRLQQWIVAVFSRIGYHKTLVAIANKHARIIWALLVKGEDFDVQRSAPMVATVGEPQEFRNGRQFAAWLGLVPKQHSTGGKTRLGRITKRGDAYLRTLLILGAKSALQSALRKPPAGRHRLQQWIVAVFSRIGYHKTLVAIANKHARIIWALLVKGEDFDVQRSAPKVVIVAAA